MKILSGSAALALLALTGCDSGTPQAAPTPPPAASTTASAPATDCVMPVSFDLLPGWEADPVDVSRMTPLQAGFLRGGAFDAVCSVDGKPAGKPGFVRVYASDVSTGSRTDDLKAFVSAFTVRNGEALNYEVRNPKYTAATIGGRPGAEATWTRYDKDKKTGSDYTAFTVDTPSGPVVVLEVPYTPAEKANVRPAYELARETLTVG
ncbi:lipoprotein [Actinoplanes utahensis]|uniref:lipoprotein n=1 Tax=Actinoplanes utahensis TaxID=1869 RepID=UPI00068A9122|nr:lipoprotein [Actinoplanes utahensis]GIF29828.1 hypothetical protein Aut01nite_28140 [Actinoplanes utahensis]